MSRVDNFCEIEPINGALRWCVKRSGLNIHRGYTGGFRYAYVTMKYYHYACLDRGAKSKGHELGFFSGVNIFVKLMALTATVSFLAADVPHLSKY